VSQYEAMTENEALAIWKLMDEREQKTLWLERCQDEGDYQSWPFDEFIKSLDQIHHSLKRRALKANGLLR